MRIGNKWRRRLAAGLVAASLFAGPAFAQRNQEEPKPPYDVPGLEHSKVWVPWVFAFLFAAGVVAIAVKNPHRTHLD